MEAKASLAGGGFVAVHCGAGYHSHSKSEAYLQLVKKCCLLGKCLVQSGHSCSDIVTQMVKTLEDSALSNAGYGSNLTLDGSIQCDASMMEGDGSYAAMGALEKIKNPIAAVYSLLTLQRVDNLKRVGIMPPLLLVGPSAHDWAVANGAEAVMTDDLIDNSARKNHRRMKAKLERFLNPPPEKACRATQDNHSERLTSATDRSKENKLEDIDSEPDTKRQHTMDDDSALYDTVGAVCVDSMGRIVSAVSSGGPLLKQPGRVGQAAMYGAGCWAAEATPGKKIATTTTGCGEHIMRTFLAKEISHSLMRNSSDGCCAVETVDQCLKDRYLNHPFVKSQPNKLCGVLAVWTDECDDSLSSDCRRDRVVSVVASHTSASFCFGWMSSEDNLPTAMISRMGGSETPGHSVVTSEHCCKLKLLQ